MFFITTKFNQNYLASLRQSKNRNYLPKHSTIKNIKKKNETTIKNQSVFSA